MEPTVVTVVSSFGTAIFVAGIAWGTIKKGLNGTSERVKEIHERLHSHIKDESDADKHTHERIARVETKIDLLSERIK